MILSSVVSALDHYRHHTVTAAPCCRGPCSSHSASFQGWSVKRRIRSVAFKADARLTSPRMLILTARICSSAFSAGRPRATLIAPASFAQTQTFVPLFQYNSTQNTNCSMFSARGRLSRSYLSYLYLYHCYCMHNRDHT